MKPCFLCGRNLNKKTLSNFFVKPLTVPIGECEALFSMWQESKRKDIEQFFGVFKKKFHFFSKPIPFLYMEDIIDAFYCSIILHNMAVTERIDSLMGKRTQDEGRVVQKK